MTNRFHLPRPTASSRAAALAVVSAVSVVVGLATTCSCRIVTAADPSAVPAVRESAPEIYYLQDDAGRLVPVPGFRYRDFVELLRAREGLPGLPEPPPAVLENVMLRVTMPPPGPPPPAEEEGGREPGFGAAPDVGATPATVTVEMLVRQTRPGWVSLPLSFDGLLLTAAPRHDGQGRMLLAPGSLATGGYRLWLAGPDNQSDEPVRHAVTLEGTIACERSRTHESLSLQVPRATATLVEIRTPRIGPDVFVRPASPSARVSAAPDGTGSIVALAGVAGPVLVRLGAAPVAGAAAPAGGAVPQASVESLVKIDGRVAVTEATLRLEDLAADTRTIHVALPPRTRLRKVGAPAELVGVTGPDERPEAEIHVDRGADGGALVELETECPVDPTGRQAFEPLGFVVRDIPAWRQWGRVSLVAPADWQLDWDDLAGPRRIDPPAAARRPGFVAAFAYDAQPARLPIRVQPRGSRVVVEPEYRCDVSAARVSLDARLRVSVRGTPVSRIALDIDGFDIDEVGPPGVVDVTGVSSDGGRLVIPFVPSLSGDAEIQIRGGLPLSPQAERVRWRIPAPQADLVGPASIVVTAQSDIELLPDAAGMRGLVRQLTPPGMRSDADRVALAYRLDGTEGVFEAARRFLPRRVDADVSVQVDIGAADTIVRETIRYDVIHVPLEFVLLSVPETVARGAVLEVRQDGLLLDPEEVAAGDAGDVDESPTGVAAPPANGTKLRALLARPLLGAGELTVRYELPTPSVAPDATRAEDVPLVLPLAARIGRQSVTLSGPDALSIDVRGEAWKRELAAPGAGGSRTWTTARAQSLVPLALSARKRRVADETVVDAAWLQTRLTGDRREDIFRYAIGTVAADEISFSLSPDLTAALAERPGQGAAAPAEATSISVRLNGQPQPGAVRPDGNVVVDLPRRAAAATWIIEVVATRRLDGTPWLTAGAAGLPKAVGLEAPRFRAGTIERRFFWELLLDPDEHPFGHPRGWTVQRRWRWGPLGPVDAATVSRDALAGWLLAVAARPVDQVARWDGVQAAEAPAASQLSPDPPAAGARVVYAGIGAPGTGRILVVPTWLLVLFVSAPLLGLGLVALHHPPLRRIPVLVAAVAVASVGAASFPETAPLVALAGLPGAGLLLLAAGLQAIAAKNASPRSVQAAPSASSLTHIAPQPSLIISPAMRLSRSEGSAAEGGEP